MRSYLGMAHLVAARVVVTLAGKRSRMVASGATVGTIPQRGVA